ncbi:MAG: hypothetical protein Q7R98_00690 [Candidatus Jorgensenbacteria bacterium]|nr:hypothetical protein [Candidatus Jorgensenbacteria bacterium]
MKKLIVLVAFLFCNQIMFIETVAAQSESQWDVEFKNTFVPTDQSGSDKTIIDRDLVTRGKYPIIILEDKVVSITFHFRITDRPISERKGPASSGFIGLQFSPISYVGFEGGVGFSSYTREGLIRGAVWLGEMTSTQGDYYLFTEVESGGSNGWYGRSNFRVNLTDWVGIGALLESNTGGGPRFDIMIPTEIPISIYLAGLVRWGSKKLKTENIFGVVGIQIIF